MQKPYADCAVHIVCIFALTGEVFSQTLVTSKCKDQPSLINRYQIDRKMKFSCKEVSIDDEDLGCTISFSENVDNDEFEKERTSDEIMDSIGQYITLQRTYSEDEFEKDCYSFESSDFDKSGELVDFKINLYRTQFVMTFEKELYEIQINVDDQKFENLKVVLTKIAKGKGQLNFRN